MQLKFILAAALGLAVGANASFNANTSEFKLLWDTWKQVHNKSYTLVEEAERFAIFTENYLNAVAHNAKSTTYKKGLNQFSDLTGLEFKQIYASGYKGNKVRAPKYDKVDYSILNLPTSVDWRTKGAVTAIKDQGQCGSCWAFSAVGALEGLNFLSKGKLLSFSEQQLVDCVTADLGCDGGLMDDAFTYTETAGIELETDYPYVSGGTEVAGTCTYKKAKAHKVNKAFTDVDQNDVNALKTAIVQQPISVAIEADQDIFQGYTSGVITADDDCGAELDHGVLAVGWDSTQGQEAFIIKNSWADTWGDKGYVYLSTDGSANDGAGVCGILSDPSFPTA